MAPGRAADGAGEAASQGLWGTAGGRGRDGGPEHPGQRQERAGWRQGVELGPGTGALTVALAARLGRHRLALVEREPVFCRRLAARFPDARVIEGDAADLPRLSAALPVDAVVISGLPLDGLAPDLRARIIAKALEVSAGAPLSGSLMRRAFPSRVPGFVARA